MLTFAASAFGYGVYVGAIDIPDRYNPWAPLDVMAPPDALTGYKLSRARRDPTLCLEALAQTSMKFDAVPDRQTGAGCGFENAVRLNDAGIRLGGPVTLSCPMALSFFMWERHALQPAAQAVYGERVVAIDHFGSYACRNINRGEGAMPGASRSRHATADALDVAGFTLASGRRVSVLRDWTANDAAADSPQRQPAFLREAHQGACTFFNGVLGPDYNAAHRDHFHLETGGFGMCR